MAANERAFDAWLDRFFAHYYAMRPVNATFIGVHNHDHAGVRGTLKRPAYRSLGVGR